MNAPSSETFPPWSKLSCALTGCNPSCPCRFRGTKKWASRILRRSGGSQKQEALNHLHLPAAVVLYPSGCRSALPTLFAILAFSSVDGGSAKVGRRGSEGGGGGWRAVALPSTWQFSWQSSSINAQSVSLFHRATGRVIRPPFFITHYCLFVFLPETNRQIVRL